MSYKLKDYKKWVDEVYNYWDNYFQSKSIKSMYSSYLTDFYNTLNAALDRFKQSVKNYKSRFPTKKFKQALNVYMTYYFTYYVNYLPQTQKADIGPLTNYIAWYSYTLPDDYSTLFQIVEDTSSDSSSDSSTTTTVVYVLDTTGIDNLISEIDSLDDSKTLGNLIDILGDKVNDVALGTMLGGIKLKPNPNNTIKFEDLTKYKEIMKEFNISIPGVK